MFRSVVPRLAAHARQASSRVKGVNRLQPSRAFGDRWLPLKRRNTWVDRVDDFFSRRSGASMFDHNMRRMGRHMDEMVTSMRGAERGMPGWCRYYGFTDDKVAVIRQGGQFKVTVDVRDYKPEDVSVRTSGDRLIVRAESKREVDNDKFFSTREFTVAIPEEVEADTFEPLLSEDGVLAISAKMKEVPPQEEKIIDIKHEPRKKDSKE